MAAAYSEGTETERLIKELVRNAKWWEDWSARQRSAHHQRLGLTKARECRDLLLKLEAEDQAARLSDMQFVATSGGDPASAGE
jgi:hypothetical protein